MNRATAIHFRNQAFARWKWLLSFRKSDWQLSDYPVLIREQKIDPELPTRFNQHSHSAYIVNWTISGSGNSPQEAKRVLEGNLRNAKERRELDGKAPARPGVKVPIEFAPQERITFHQALSEDFIHRVLELDWAWISDESSLWDFHHLETNDLLFSKIQHVYGVDVSDVERANLADILDRIAAQSHE